MPVTFDLRSDGQVIYFKITEPWTMDEVLAGFGQTRSMREEVRAQHPHLKVHSLIDLTEVTSAPPGVLRSRQAPGLSHPNRGEFVVATTFPLARELMLTVFKIMHIEGKLFDTLDEAWDYLRPLLQSAPDK